MSPEGKARQQIDEKLIDAGWVVQDVRNLNLGAALGVAVREYPTNSGPADYVLFVKRTAVGVIEAKRDEAGENLTATEVQTTRYAHAALKWCVHTTHLSFLFESTAQITRFTDGRDPVPRSREVFHFFRLKQLAHWLEQPTRRSSSTTCATSSLPTTRRIAINARSRIASGTSRMPIWLPATSLLSNKWRRMVPWN